MDADLSTADRRRAADQLGVPPDAGPAEAWAAFLRRLPAAGFCPPPPLCAAAAGLAGRPVPGAAGVVVEPDGDDDAMQAEVTAFVKEFWSLRPDLRRSRWQELLARSAADPRLTARLRRLEVGVDLRDATGVPGPPRQRDLVGMCQSLFVLGPIERAARRRELLDGLPPPAAAWEQAAHDLERDLPGYASLEPALIERLASWTRRFAAPAAASNRPAPTWGFQTVGGIQVPQATPVVNRRPARRSAGWSTFLWIGIVLTLVRVIAGVSRDTTTPAVDPARKSPLSRYGPPPAEPKPESRTYRPVPDEALRFFDKKPEPKAPDRGSP